MAGITGLGTTFNLPNYVGELFAKTPADTPFLSAIGGLTGGISANGETEHSWQTYDLRDAADRQRVEGADAPTADERVRANVSNVLEIHQEKVEVSYTKQAARNRLGGVGQGAGTNPVQDEVQWQVDQQIKQVGRDTEFSFIGSRYHKPSDNTTARRTRGILQAAGNVEVKGTAAAFSAAASTDNFTSNAHGLSDGDRVAIWDFNVDGGITIGAYYVVSSATNTFKVAKTSGGSALDVLADFTGQWAEVTAPDSEDVLDLLQKVWDAGGISEQETATIMVNGSGKRLLTKEFITDANYQEGSRTVGGVHVSTIETDFGTLNVMPNRLMPAGAMSVVSLDQCAPVFLEIPGKGHFFVEELAKTGAQNKAQLYGEIGLKYGNPDSHGLLLGAF